MCSQALASSRLAHSLWWKWGRTTKAHCRKIASINKSSPIERSSLAIKVVGWGFGMTTITDQSSWQNRKKGN